MQKKPRSPREAPRVFRLRTRRIVLTIAVFASGSSGLSHAEMSAQPPVEFNDDFLVRPSGQSIDLSRFSRGNPVLPGDYIADVYLNGNWIAHQSMHFIGDAGSFDASACFDKTIVTKLGLNPDVLSQDGRDALARAQTGQCVRVDELVPNSTYTFDTSDLRLDISIAQASLLRNPRGYVSPELWDSGVTSGTLAYSANVFHSAGHADQSNTNSYLRLDAGFNVGSWHLRHSSNMNWNASSANSPFEDRATSWTRTYQNIETYVQHDIPSIRSQLRMGDTFTDGALFDRVGIRGVTIASDDRMLAPSLQGYAPLIRGIARSNARVEVLQNGYKIYETTVAPGQFEINDLYPTGYGGDITVAVHEADGSVHSFSVPFSSVAQLLRPGLWRFSAAAGVPREIGVDSHDPVFQGTAQHGFNNLLTGYSGIVASRVYRAALAGAAFNTPIGAIAFDVTAADAQIPTATETRGYSLRATYSNILSATQTSLSVAAYRYSSKGFWSLRDTLYANASNNVRRNISYRSRPRNQFNLTLNQPLPEGWGSVYASGIASDSWESNGTSMTFTAGYSNFARVFGQSLSYNVTVTRQRNLYTAEFENQVFASVNIPLGRGQHAANMQTNVSRSSTGQVSAQTLVSGTLGEENAFTYGFSAGRNAGSTSGSANAQYAAPWTTVGGSVGTTGGGGSQWSFSTNGEIVAHPGGVTFANSAGETIAVVEAKHAEGARISSAPGVRVDGFGYAVVPYLSPYMLNTIDIDPTGLPLDVEFKSTSQQVAPRANSVVMVRFDTVSGRSALISLADPSGQVPPFGASIFDAQGSNVGDVGQSGRAFVRGIADEGTLVAKWGDAKDQQCTFDYSLPPSDASPASAFAQSSARCAGLPNNTARGGRRSEPQVKDSKIPAVISKN